MARIALDGSSRQSTALATLQSFWFLKSDQLGKVSVGKQSDAADNAAILVDGSGSLVPANWVAFDVNSFGIRTKSGSFANNGMPTRMETASQMSALFTGAAPTARRRRCLG